MVKRKGYILEQIADMDNLRAADKEAQAGKVKKNRNIRKHNEHAEADLLKLREMILTCQFPDDKYIPLILKCDCGKERQVDKQKYFPWRILHHAIMRVIEKDLYSSLIGDTFACIPGKGLHFGVKRMKMMLRRYPEYQYFWKVDYRKYYQSIPHETVITALRRKYKDERFIHLIETAVLNYESGSDVNEQLEDERLRNQKRTSHRSIHKSASRKLQFRSSGPPHEGGCRV